MNRQDKKHARVARITAMLLGGTALAGSLAGSALAQDATPASTKDKSTQSVETVTVTAERREQNILDVPYNISVVSGETIEQNQIHDPAELMRSIPGVSVVDRGDRNASVVNGIRIRGLNVDSSALGDYAVSAAATVSTYVDDTPIFANFALKDIDRVEVLKGPQGTLYGSGSLGGTVRYIMRAPELDTFDGQVSLTGSQVNGSGGIGYSGDAVLNIPLGDTMALRISGTRFDYPGLTDYVNLYKLDAYGNPVAPNGLASTDAEYYKKKNADFYNGWYERAALLWKPSSNFDATLSFMDQSENYGGRRAEALGTDGYGRPYKQYESGAVMPEPGSRDAYLASLEANLNLGFATLTSSTSYYDQHGKLTSDNTGFYAQNAWLIDFYYNYPRPMAQAKRTYGDKAFIQEMRLVSNSTGPWDYVLGVYYEDQTLSSTQDSFLRGFKQWWDAAYCGFYGPCEDAVIDNQDYLYRHQERYTDAAVYGELTYHFNDRLQATGGFRYFSDESKTHVYQVTALWAGYRDFSDSRGKFSQSKPLFKANVSWKFDDDDMLYGTVSQGYRRGGSNGTPITGFFAESPAWLSYKPDTNTDYEIGAKGRFGNITYNADVFYVDWSNPQLNTATTFWGFFAVQNGKKATTKGVEVQLDGFAGNWHYGVGYTYTEAELGANLYSADGLYEINSKGTTLPGAPRNTLNGVVDYNIPFDNGSNLTLHLDGYYQSSSLDTIFSKYISLNPFTSQPKFYQQLSGFWLWNTSASYSMGKWNATLWMKNIFNDQAITGVYTQAYMGTSPLQNYYGNASKAVFGLPRTIGLTLSYKF